MGPASLSTNAWSIRHHRHAHDLESRQMGHVIGLGVDEQTARLGPNPSRTAGAATASAHPVQGRVPPRHPRPPTDHDAPAASPTAVPQPPPAMSAHPGSAPVHRPRPSAPARRHPGLPRPAIVRVRGAPTPTSRTTPPGSSRRTTAAASPGSRPSGSSHHGRSSGISLCPGRGFQSIPTALAHRVGLWTSVDEKRKTKEGAIRTDGGN